MKRVNKISIACLFASIFLFSSCFNKFLTLYPLNEIVLENYWTEKADVESTLRSVYAAMESKDCIEKMILFGEVRSDNIVDGQNPQDDVKQFTKDNILETNGLVKWDCFYKVINLANTIMYYAPEVQRIDPNYTRDELNANLAEAMFLRCLSYFYLIRSYKDVPYVTRPSIDDSEDFHVGVTPFEEVLDSLIADMEFVKDYAVNRYAGAASNDNTLQLSNTARVTRAAAYSLLCDLYLWKGDWDKCIECANVVFNRKYADYEEYVQKYGESGTPVYDMRGYPLYPEMTEGSTQVNEFFYEVFGIGNSMESIFELTFMSNSTKNESITKYYGGQTQQGWQDGCLSGNSELYVGVATGTNALFGEGAKYSGKFDTRCYYSTYESNSKYWILKYSYDDVFFKSLKGGAVGAPTVSRSSRSETEPSNWIVYRLPDVMLMKAEALVMKAKQFENVEADTLSGTEERSAAAAEKNNLFQQAFQLVQVVNLRAVDRHDYTTNSSCDTLKLKDFNTSATAMEELVFNERRREFLFEGKRWFDLVRMARRDGNTERLVNYVLPKHTQNQSAIRIRLADMDAIYFPIFKEQIKINPLLHQNPAYIQDDYSEHI